LTGASRSAPASYMLSGKHREAQMPVRLPIRPQPEIEWQLLSLLHLRGPLATQAVYRALADRFQLSAEERKATIGEERPEPAWANECRFAKRRLVDEGCVVSRSRGIWAITSKGSVIAEQRGLEYRSTTRTAAELGL
jgi:restriction endonuclease Mrr